MKAKRLLLAIAALAIAGAIWLTQTHREPVDSETKSDMGMGAGAAIPDGQPTPAHMLRAPDPNRRFREMTPEHRAQFARKPFGVGG